MATTALPLEPSTHAAERLQERDLTLRAAKRAVKHGTVRPGHTPGRVVHEFEGVKAVTDDAALRLITAARRDRM